MPTTSAARPSSYRPRFSLRSLLLMVTFCGLVLAPLAVRIQRAHQQRLAVQELRKRGGKVTYDYQVDKNDSPVRGARASGYRWLRNIVGNDFFDEVVWVSMPAQAGPDVLHHVAKFTELRGLVVPCQQLEAASLVHLAALDKLESLDLQYTELGDDALEYLARHNKLQWLGLYGTNVTDAELHRLAACSNLKTLVVRKTRVTSEGKAAFQQLLPVCDVELVEP